MVPLDFLLDMVVAGGVIVAIVAVAVIVSVVAVAVAVAVAVVNEYVISVLFSRTTTTIPCRTAIISSFSEHSLSRSLPLLRLPILLSSLLRLRFPLKSLLHLLSPILPLPPLLCLQVKPISL